MVLWGRSVLGRQKVPRKVPPRFHQGSSKDAPRFHQSSSSFVVSLVLWGRSVLGCQKVPRKVPPRFQQGSSKVPPRFFKFRGVFGWADLSWAAKRFCGRFTMVPPKFFKFRGVAGFLGQIRLGLPKGSAEGSTKVPARFHQGSTKVLQVSWCLWLGRSVLGRQKILWKIHQGSTTVLQVSWCLWFSGADPSWAGKRFRVNMSYPFTSSPQKATHHVVAVGIFFGLILYCRSLFSCTHREKVLA